MDQDTRNKLQRATQQVRRILEEEFAEQLEGTFDVLPNGKILPEPGKHLDARQRLTRRKLVDAIEHIKARGKTPQEAVEEYTREAAFTFLNRFVALRMLEARGLLQECVSKGDASSGFKEFSGLAPGMSSLDDGGYRLYLECLFDELTVEVKVLFDRRDSASLLWPRRAALTGLLGILSETGLSSVWSEDETIGWVYQYFNSGEERKKMRDESQAPRNSRELAVRNQFFTPRYVVEFLTDNTLGRIWYEMQQGDTHLVDDCKYLVRRPNEVFLSEGQEPPAENNGVEEDLGQEDLLKKAFYIPYRVKKDPRDLKILDPACGSGHFLLYAFDLLISIYEEAWHDDAIPKSKATGQRLRDDYLDVEQLHAAMPGLVLAHNLHGIDIDPRAAQIAALALWMRGQRAFNEFQINRKQRQRIERSSIVCAEPMPGEAAFLDEFIANYLSNDAEGRFLASLVRKVFDAMKLAGEAGSLLKIEEDIAEEVSKAKKQWLKRPEYKQQTLFERAQSTVQKELDLSRGITDESFWDEAEERIYECLRAYSEQAERSGGFQRRLFAADAAKGFAFIDLCRRRYDVTLMNPPFGECSTTIVSKYRKKWKSLANDIYVLFFVTAEERTAERGIIGAITSRGFVAGRDQRFFRPRVLGERESLLTEFVDLGLDVLDGAAVETALSIISTRCENERLIWFKDVRDEPRELLNTFDTLLIEHAPILRKGKRFLDLPQSAILYTATDEELEALTSTSKIDPDFGKVTPGLQTSDNERFMFLYWEVPVDTLGKRWQFCAKGGDYQWCISNIITVVDWNRNGQVIAASTAMKSDNVAQARRSSTYYFRPALTFTYRCSDFSLRCLPRGSIFNNSGPVFSPNDESELVPLLSFFLTKKYEGLLRLVEKKGKYDSGRLGGLPKPKMPERKKAVATWHDLMRVLFKYERQCETSPYFAGLTRHTIEHGIQCDSVEIRQSIQTFACSSGLPVSDEFVTKASDAFHRKYSRIDQKAVISYSVGRVLGRFGGAESSETPDSFASLADQLPAVHAATEGENGSASWCLAEKGICSHQTTSDNSQMVRAIQQFINHYVGIGSDLPMSDLSEYLSKGSGFFADHIAQYSGAFRRAPVYWQLATSSASYSVWMYYHAFTKDTFFIVLNEFVRPELDHARKNLDRLRSEVGAEPTRSQRKQAEDLEQLVAELASMVEEVERIAPLWNPNLNDGVIINFAPLWRLVPQNKSWQKECKKCWDKLVKGEYDWAHVAMHLWPERVVPKCVTDASLAIAHGLEEVFWEQDERDRFQPKEEPAGGWEPVIKELVDERTSPAVNAALESLLTAPAPAGNSKSRRRKATT
jgi:hypothetical protein